MNLLSNNTFKKPKKLLTLLIIGVSLILILASLNFYLTEVSAQIIPITVSVEYLDFGTVFPGENLQGNFTVFYADEGNGITYRIIQKRKPLPTGHLEYPDGGDPEMPGYYRNLCPFLTKVSVEQEGDTEKQAFVGPNDLSDTWVIYFKVPAIVGHVGQDHIGGVVTSNGEYGCDISIDVDLEDICRPEEELVINGGFEQPVVTDPAKWDIFESGTSGLGWTVEWRGDIPSEYSGYTRPDPALQEIHRGVNNWNPYEGEQYAELDTDWDGPGGSLSGEPASVIIYQDIPTLPGVNYSISSAFSPRPNTDAANNILEFSWDGEVKDTISRAGSSSIDWSEHSYTFTASTSTTRIQFIDKGTADSLGTFLDNVSVRCWPQ